MATRAFWKGFLKLSLVTCPVAMSPATTENAKVRFHVLNRRTGARVVSRYVDERDGSEIEEGGLAKGYAKGEDDFALFDEDELDAVELESTRTIDIEYFAPDESIDWIWYDKPHYLAPDGPVGEEAFAVIRDVMKSTGTVGLSRLVLYRRERPLLVKPRDNGIMAWTLRYADEVRKEDDYSGETMAPKTDQQALELVSQLIDKMSVRWDAKMAHDPVQEKLLEIIAAKRERGARRVEASERPAAPAPHQVVNIIDALRKSLRSAS